MRESRAPRGLETREGRSPVSFSEKEAPVIINAFFALYGPVTNTCPFLESSLLRVIVRFSCLWQGPRHSRSFFFALFVKLVHTCRRHLKDVFDANSSAMYLHCVVSWCSAYREDLWEVPMNEWWLKSWQLSRCHYVWRHQPLFFYYTLRETLWAGPGDEPCKVGSPCSCDEHHVSMIFEDRTR